MVVRWELGPGCLQKESCQIVRIVREKRRKRSRRVRCRGSVRVYQPPFYGEGTWRRKRRQKHCSLGRGAAKGGSGVRVISLSLRVRFKVEGHVSRGCLIANSPRLRGALELFEPDRSSLDRIRCRVLVLHDPQGLQGFVKRRHDTPDLGRTKYRVGQLQPGEFLVSVPARRGKEINLL